MMRNGRFYAGRREPEVSADAMVYRRRLFAGVASAGVLAAGVALAGSISALNYNTQGGAATEIGGTLEVLSGGIFRLDVGTKTATAVSGAATLNKLAGVVTSEPLTTAASSTYTLTIANSRVAAGDQVMASVTNGTNTGGGPHVGTVSAGPGALTVVVRNSAAGALNGTVVVSFVVVKN